MIFFLETRCNHTILPGLARVLIIHTEYTFDVKYSLHIESLVPVFQEMITRYIRLLHLYTVQTILNLFTLSKSAKRWKAPKPIEA